MDFCARLFLSAALAATGCAGGEETRCRTPEAHLVDEDRGCVGPAMATPELKACTPIRQLGASASSAWSTYTAPSMWPRAATPRTFRERDGATLAEKGRARYRARRMNDA